MRSQRFRNLCDIRNFQSQIRKIRQSDSKIDPRNLDFKCFSKEVYYDILAENVYKALFEAKPNRLAEDLRENHGRIKKNEKKTESDFQMVFRKISSFDAKIDPRNLDSKCFLKEVNYDTLPKMSLNPFLKLHQTVLVRNYVKTTVKKKKRKKT